MREGDLNRSRTELLYPTKSPLGAENLIFGHISPRCIFGAFFVACSSLEGAFWLPYINGHARNFMWAGFAHAQSKRDRSAEMRRLASFSRPIDFLSAM